MRLTQILLRFKKRPPRGDVNRGKYRYPDIITPRDRRDTLKQLQIEETNMLLLRRPYLTLEESFRHTTIQGVKKKYYDEKRLLAQEEYFKKKPHVKMEDRYDMLKNNDFWDDCP